MSWNDPDLLAQVAKFTPYAFIVLGGLIELRQRRKGAEYRVSSDGSGVELCAYRLLI